MCTKLCCDCEYILNQSTANFDRISNSIEISLVGRAPGQALIEFEPTEFGDTGLTSM